MSDFNRAFKIEKALVHFVKTLKLYTSNICTLLHVCILQQIFKKYWKYMVKKILRYTYYSILITIYSSFLLHTSHLNSTFMDFSCFFYLMLFLNDKFLLLYLYF